MTKRASVPLFYDFRYPRNSSISHIKERKRHEFFVEKLDDRNWKTGEKNPATIDDISVFVIPIQPYKTGE